MKSPQFLGTDCPKRRGKDERCHGCLVLAKGLCRQFSDYIEDRFKHLSKSTGQTQAADSANYTPPLLTLFLKVENNFDYEGTGSFADWLNTEYGKHQYLSMDCPQRKDDDPRCNGCPVRNAGYCQEFIDYVESRLVILQNNQKAEFVDPGKNGNDFQKGNRDKEGDVSNCTTLHTVPESDDHQEQDQSREDNTEGQDIFHQAASPTARLRNDEDISYALQALFLAVENNFTYAGNGSFKLWLQGISSKILLTLRQNYTRHGLPLKNVFKQLDGYPVKILSEKKLLATSHVEYATVPKKQPWEDSESLLIVNIKDTKVLTYLTQVKSISILVYGTGIKEPETKKQTLHDAIISTASKMEEKKGVLLWWKEELNAAVVRKTLQGIIKKEKKSLQEILHELRDNGASVEVQAGETLLNTRRIRTASTSKKLPGEITKSLLIVDIRRHKMLAFISRMNAMVVLVHGTGEYGTDQLLKTLNSAAITTQRNQGVLLWWKEDRPPENVQIILQNIFRNYTDIGSFSQPPDDEEKNDSPVDRVEEGASLWDETTWKDLLDQKELDNDIERCLEKAMISDSLKNCVSLMYHYMAFYKEFLKHPERYEEVFMENGKIRVSAIYEKLAELYELSTDAAKKRFLRCLKNGAPFARFIKGCLAEYENFS